MTEFVDQLRQRVTSTADELRAAERDGDLYTADIMAASLADLLRLASEHGISIALPGDEPVA